MEDFADYYQGVADKARADRKALKDDEQRLLSELARVRTQMNALSQVIKGISKITTQQLDADSIADVSEQDPRLITEDDNVSLEDLAITALRKQGPMKVAQLQETLEARGYKTNAKNPIAALKRRLTRLVKAGRVEHHEGLYQMPESALYEGKKQLGEKHQGKIRIAPADT